MDERFAAVVKSKNLDLISPSDYAECWELRSPKEIVRNILMPHITLFDKSGRKKGEIAKEMTFSHAVELRDLLNLKIEEVHDWINNNDEKIEAAIRKLTKDIYGTDNPTPVEKE